MREQFEKTGLGSDKEMGAKVAKMGEAKKAMPFVQGLRKRLGQGESPSLVFDRRLAFDEVEVLNEMVKGLKKTTGCKELDVVRVDEGGKTGVVVAGDAESGKRMEGLPQSAEGAVPGNPTFHFENV